MSESRELEPWQQRALNAFKGGGVVQITGRHSNKSVVQQAYKRLFDDIYQRPIEDLVLSEGKIYGSRYYTAEPVGGNWLDMESWCTETFGPGCRALWGEKKAPEPAQRWYMNNRKFWFRNERDRTLFILRWSK